MHRNSSDQLLVKESACNRNTRTSAS